MTTKSLSAAPLSSATVPATAVSASDHRIHRDIGVLALFTRVYCRANHAGRPRERVRAVAALAPYVTPLEADLCADCSRTLLHGAAKRLFCPYDPKPRCRHCPTHCYAPGHREKVRAIMRFSGMRLITRGRLDLLFKYLF